MRLDEELEEFYEHEYWKYDARVKGYNEYKGRPLSERDSFKMSLRATTSQLKKMNGIKCPQCGKMHFIHNPLYVYQIDCEGCGNTLHIVNNEIDEIGIIGSFPMCYENNRLFS